MSFLEQWRGQLPTSLAEAVRLAQTGESVDFTYGLLATAVLWPIREPVQEFDPDAIAAVKEVTDHGAAILKAMQAWNGDRLPAGRQLAEAAAADADLRRGLRQLLHYFDATHLLQHQLSGQFGNMPSHVIEHIQAALVNVGGIMAIDTLNLSLPAMPEIAPPAEPDRPPTTTHFVGRESEFAYFADKLDKNHIAVIAGMAGVGKTALAVQLVHKLARPDQVFWHSFHPGESIHSLIWELANFLAWHGQDDLWNLLQRAQQTGGQPPPPETLFNYVLQMLRGRSYLICLDDFHHIEDDPLVGSLLNQLRELLLVGELDIVVTSRRMPGFLELVQFEPLEGLNLEDTRQLLAKSDVVLAEEQLHLLHTKTVGNATFLTLAAHALKREKNPDYLLARLSQTAYVERFLLEEVDGQLIKEEQALMSAVAVLLDYPGTRDAIDVIVDGAVDVWRLLQSLSERHLIIVHEGEGQRRYSLHDIVQAFYYNTLSRQQRRAMHRRAADYYQKEEHDPLRAGLHFRRAEDITKAASILTADPWHFVNHGQARAVSQLLSEFSARQLEPLRWSRVNLVLGQLYTFLGEGEQARSCLQQAWDILQTDDHHDPALAAAVCLAFGELLDQEVPEEAMDWLQRGLAVVEDEEGEAALYTKIGMVHTFQGNFDGAVQALQRALELVPVGANSLRCQALTNIGFVYINLGKVCDAVELTTQALVYSRRLDDHFRTADLLINLGIFQFIDGRWDEAIASWEQAHSLAGQLGSDEQQAAVAGNLGVAYCQMGDYPAARHSLQSSLEIARKRRLKAYELNALFSLAELALRQGNLEDAIDSLHKASTLAQTLEARSNMAEINGAWAEIRLAQERHRAARRIARQALQQAQDLKMKPEEGRIWRTLARVQIAEGRSEAALNSFAHSLACLEGVDPYEEARTKAEWARFLLSTGATQDATRLLQGAQATFKRIGAERDLAQLEGMALAPIAGASQ